MRIVLCPQRRDDQLTVSRDGDSLTVNGVAFDFSSLAEGDLLPANAIDSELFCGPAERINGQLVVNMILPLCPSPTEAEAFPEPVELADGEEIVLRGPWQDGE